ncbi:hypothetical protein FRC10_008654, partial [Ceratobasidium sp. 414]
YMQGANFPDVLLIVNFTNPDMVEVWSQHSGHAARHSGSIRICIMMVTKQVVTNAAKICKNAGIELDPVVLAMKVEEVEDVDLLKEEHVEEPTEDSPDAPSRSSCSARTMSLEMAEYIAKGVAGHCLTGVTDRFFTNPAHTSCYEIGSCLNCVRHQAAEEPDEHQQEQLNYTYKVAELAMELEDVELIHKKPTTF